MPTTKIFQWISTDKLRIIDEYESNKEQMLSESNGVEDSIHEGSNENTPFVHTHDELDEEHHEYYDDEEENVEDQELYPELVTIRLENKDSLEGSNQILDYKFRSDDEEFTKLSLWEYTEA